MRILVLYPFPVGRNSLGGVRRLYRLIRYLAARGHRVWLACFAQEGAYPAADLEEMRRVCEEVVVVPAVGRSRLRAAVDLAFSPDPSHVSRFRSSAMEREVARILRDADIELMHVEFTYLGEYGELAGQHCATVLVDEELNFRAAARLRAARPVSARGVRAALEERKFRRFEPHVAARFDKVLSISAEERDELLRHLPGLAVEVYPNVVDAAEEFAPRGAPAEPLTMAFVGNYEHYPNVHGLTWFVREVLPLIAAEHAGARLDVIGANVTPAVNALAGDAVRVRGFVDDLPGALARSSVFVCPVIDGGGMRGKVLEAMSLGRPVVATSIALEGIEAAHGTHALVADDPRGFARETCRVLSDPGLASRLGAAARELVVSRYDDGHVFDRVEQLYAELVRAKRAGAVGGALAAGRSAVGSVLP